MARPTSARALLFGLVATALALAACSKSSNSPLPGATPTPTVSPTVGPSSTPPPANAGVAYVPDAGDGTNQGITVLHFETFSGAAFPYTPQFASFPSPVRFLAIDTSNTVGIAVEKASNGSFTNLQGVLGVAGGNIFPGGPPYNTAVVPPSPAPTNAVIPDVTSATLLGTTTNAVGLSMGPLAQGILGVNQVQAQKVTFNGFIGFTCNGRVGTVGGYYAIQASQAVGSLTGYYTILVRSATELASFSSTSSNGVDPPRYTICFQSENPNLGAKTFVAATAGRGIMDILPTDSSRALIGQAGGANQVALVTGLPFAINPGNALVLGTRVNSVAVAPNSDFAAVGTDAGLFILGGLEASALTIIGQGPLAQKTVYSPNYKGADGMYHHLTNVTSVGFSSDGSFLAAYCSLTPNSPGGGKTGTLVALPFNSGTGVLSAPAVALNSLPLLAYYQDLLTVR